jgi:hypothetical protein
MISAKRALKRIHLAGTIWFMICVGYMLILALRQVGFNWWLIFSLSGHSALMVFLLVSLYMFAFVRGVGNTQHIYLEHPLTSTDYYMGFYVSAPLLGGLAGVLGMSTDVPDIRHFLLGVALGTLGTTFAVWVVVDPLAGLIEMLLPPSRRYRAQRLKDIDAERRGRHKKREHLLAEAFAREEQERQRWQERLRPHAERLAVLSISQTLPGEQTEREALRIGALAWKLGGLTCMRQLRDMTLQIVENQQGSGEAVDYISYWWDGVGNWRRPTLS